MAIRTVSRRKLLQITSASVIAAPTYIRSSALASNLELNVFFWSDELPQSVLDGFEQETGIRIRFTGYGSNDEMMARLRLTEGQGYDIVSPSYTRALSWPELDLTQPWDIAGLPMERISAQGRGLTEVWDFEGRGPHWLPHVWGANGMAWRTDLWQPEGPMPSYGDIWDDAYAGRTMGHVRGLFLGTGLWMETTGALPPGAMQESYTTPDQFRPTWEEITRFCIAKKPNLRMIWSNADMIRQGFMMDGVILGQTWDGPPTAMKNEGLPVTYRSPKEGAQGWIDGMSLIKDSPNAAAAHAFVEYVTRPEVAGAALNEHGYNTFVLGAVEFAGERYRENFKDAYPGDSLERMWFRPAHPTWVIELETEYMNRFRAA